MGLSVTPVLVWVIALCIVIFKGWGLVFAVPGLLGIVPDYPGANAYVSTLSQTDYLLICGHCSHRVFGGNCTISSEEDCSDSFCGGHHPDGNRHVELHDAAGVSALGGTSYAVAVARYRHHRGNVRLLMAFAETRGFDLNRLLVTIRRRSQGGKDLPNK